jgi:hypothetical protein
MMKFSTPSLPRSLSTDQFLQMARSHSSEWRGGGLITPPIAMPAVPPFGPPENFFGLAPVATPSPSEWARRVAANYRLPTWPRR